MAETTQAVQAKPKRGMSKSLRDSLVAYRDRKSTRLNSSHP